MMNKFLLFFLVIVTRSIVTTGQGNSLPGIIPSIFYRGNITNRFDYNFFASSTFIPVRSIVEGRKYPGRNSEIYFQPSLVYKHSHQLNIAVGYTYIKANSFTPAYETEQLIWQQIIFEHRAFNGLMLQRLRISENLKKDHVSILNYQIAYEKPLEGRVLEEGEFYFSCFNESFLNLSVTPGFYSSNWTFVGLGFKTFKAGKIEVGPLIQTLFNRGKGNDTLCLLQILWLGDSKLFRRK